MIQTIIYTLIITHTIISLFCIITSLANILSDIKTFKINSFDITCYIFMFMLSITPIYNVAFCYYCFKYGLEIYTMKKGI